MTPREAILTALAFRTGLLVGTINLARDTEVSVEEIAEVTHLGVEEIRRLSGSVTS